MFRLDHKLSALALCLALAGSLAACAQDQTITQDIDVATSTSEFVPAPLEENHLADDLRDAMGKVHGYDSVTLVTSTRLSTDPSKDPADEEPLTNSVKFDTTGGVTRSCASYDVFGTELKTYVEGDKAAIDDGSAVYGGTVEELDLGEMTGVDAYLDSKVGAFESVCACAADVKATAKDGGITYSVEVDPALYVTQDENWAGMVEEGSTLDKYVVDYGFAADGRLASVRLKEDTSLFNDIMDITFEDYDETVVDPMPEADKPASAFMP